MYTACPTSVYRHRLSACRIASISIVCCSLCFYVVKTQQGSREHRPTAGGALFLPVGGFAQCLSRVAGGAEQLQLQYLEMLPRNPLDAVARISTSSAMALKWLNLESCHHMMTRLFPWLSRGTFKLVRYELVALLLLACA